MKKLVGFIVVMCIANLEQSPLIAMHDQGIIYHDGPYVVLTRQSIAPDGKAVFGAWLNRCLCKKQQCHYLIMSYAKIDRQSCIRARVRGRTLISILEQHNANNSCLIGMPSDKGTIYLEDSFARLLSRHLDLLKLLFKFS